jgi:hypothetical protein
MVRDMPHRSSSSSEPMLDTVWRAAAQRVPVPGVIACIACGLAGAISLAVADHLRPIAAACVILAAFGAYAAVVQRGIGGTWLGPSAQRVLATVFATVAVLAGLATGLLLLAAIFGGSIEVMRR